MITKTARTMFALVLGLAVATFVAVGCGGGTMPGAFEMDPTSPSTSDDSPSSPGTDEAAPVITKGTFKLQLAWETDDVSARVIPTGTDSIDLRIRPAAGEAAELTDTINKSEVTNGTVSREYNLMPGNGKILEIDALDSSNQIVAQASVSMDITVAALTQVSLTLSSTGILDPVVSASATPETGRPGDAITLKGTASDPDGELVEMAWDTDGDGTFDKTTTNVTTGKYDVTVTPQLGDYTATFRATDNDGLTTTTTISYSIKNADAELVVSPGTLTFDSVTNTATLSVSNPGDVDLNWEATTSDSWLSLSKTSGTNGATITVTVARSVLSAGTYTPTVSFTSNGGSKTVDVTVEVTRAEMIVN